MYSACRVGYPWPPCKRLYPRQKKGAPFRFRPTGRKLHIRFLLLPFPPETRFAELSGGSPRGGSGRRRRPGVPGVGAQKSRDGNAVTAFLASAQLPWRLSFPHFFVRSKKWGRRRHLPPLAQREVARSVSDGSEGSFPLKRADPSVSLAADSSPCAGEPSPAKPPFTQGGLNMVLRLQGGQGYPTLQALYINPGR